MLKRIKQILTHSRCLQKINFALSRGSAASALRNIDPTNPRTWEFSGFSQNGEDGILEVLLSRISNPNRYFIEIGTADGLENNTSWLAIVQRYSGLCIEGNSEKSECHRSVFTPLNYGLKFLNLFVSDSSIKTLEAQAIHSDPDVFSLDIDGNDYHVARAILERGLRPKVFAVEFNSAFGPEVSATIPYREDFEIGSAKADRLYYGCSIAGWQSLFSGYDYQFVTVDQNGVNAFFVHRGSFDSGFLKQIAGLTFAENFSQLNEHGHGWREQYSLIQNRPFQSIDAS